MKAMFDKHEVLSLTLDIDEVVGNFVKVIGQDGLVQEIAYTEGQLERAQLLAAWQHRLMEKIFELQAIYTKLIG